MEVVMRTWLVLSAALALAGPLPHAAPAAPPPIAATLADVAFLEGHWRGGDPGELSEEVWSAPEGDSMVGMWRYVAKGRARLFEMLSLKEGGRQEFRFRRR
jgi:hypothetical protein